MDIRKRQVDLDTLNTRCGEQKWLRLEVAPSRVVVVVVAVVVVKSRANPITLLQSNVAAN